MIFRRGGVMQGGRRGPRAVFFGKPIGTSHGVEKLLAGKTVAA